MENILKSINKLITADNIALLSVIITILIFIISRHIEIRACLISSNEDGDESKSKHLSRNKEFSLTIFPKSAEFVEPAK